MKHALTTQDRILINRVEKGINSVISGRKMEILTSFGYYALKCLIQDCTSQKIKIKMDCSYT